MGICPVCGEPVVRVYGTRDQHVCNNYHCRAYDVLVLPVGPKANRFWVEPQPFMGFRCTRIPFKVEETPDETNADSGRRTD